MDEIICAIVLGNDCTHSRSWLNGFIENEKRGATAILRQACLKNAHDVNRLGIKAYIVS